MTRIAALTYCVGALAVAISPTPASRQAAPEQEPLRVFTGARLIDPATARVTQGAYTEENTRRQLGVFARYGITTVWSLDGERAPAFAARDSQNTPALDRARLYVAGSAIVGKTPDDARQMVATNAFRATSSTSRWK